MVQENCVKPKIVVIVGPTGVGKTALSISLAKKFGGEIVSADSIQIYKGLDIGSAKVTKEEMQGIKHYLIDIVEPTDTFNASDYSLAAKEAIEKILAKGKLPIVVGGTGMYVQSLLFNLSVPCGKDEEYREKLEKIAQKEGTIALYNMLKEVDRETAEKLNQNHKDRIIRALEIYHLTKKKKSEFTQNTSSDYDYLLLCLTADREVVYERINLRVDKMLESGLVDEVKGLLKKNITIKNQCMQAIGYKETIKYLEGQYSYDEFVEKLKQNSRHYAKRQFTYFKKMPNIKYVEYDQKENIFKQVEEFLWKESKH